MVPPKMALVRIIGNPNHTAETDRSERRCSVGTGSCSYSWVRPWSVSGAAGAVMSVPLSRVRTEETVGCGGRVMGQLLRRP